jgi:hypothetical protein
LSSGGAPNADVVSFNLGAGGKGGIGIEAANGADGLAKDAEEFGPTVNP